MTQQEIITELTPEQRAKFPEYREKWLKIGLATGPLEFEKAKEALSRCYKVAGFDPPKKFYRAKSPLDAVKKNVELNPDTDEQEVTTASFRQIYGSHDASWLSFYDFMLNEVKLDCCEKLVPLMDLATCCGWVLPYREYAILQDRPVAIHREDEQLHCDGGAAIEYSDGFSIYCLHGVRVPEWLAVTPMEELDPARLPKIDNAQVRAEFVRKVGIDRVIHKLSKGVIDKEGNYELHDLDLGDEEYRPYLKMLNPSVPDIWHVEGVAPECRTVAEALKWRNSGIEETPEILT